MKKNALIIAYNSMNNSGVPNVIYQTIKALCDDYRFDIVTFDEASKSEFYKTVFITQGIDVNFYYFVKKSKNNKFYKLWWHLFGKYHYWKKETAKILKLKKYDVIHSFKEFDSFPFLKVAKKNKIATRLLHTNVNHTKENTSLIERTVFYKKILSIKHSTQRIAVSQLSGMNAFNRHPFIVIHNPINESIYKYSEKRPNVLTLGQVGTFSSNKNQLFTIDVFKEIKKIIPDAKLLFVGFENEEGYLAKMKEQISNSDTSNSISIIDGRMFSIVPYIDMSMLILPSHHEGASIVTMEAQACGLQCIVSDAVSKEMNIGGVTFLKLSEGPKYWSNVIIEQYNQSLLRKEYKLNDFSNDTFKEKISAVYSKS